MNPFRTRRQAIAMMAVSVSIVIACVVSMAVAQLLMPANAAGRKGVQAIYFAFTPMLVVWSALGVWAYQKMPSAVKTIDLPSDQIR